jgi:hypothetical protein
MVLLALFLVFTPAANPTPPPSPPPPTPPLWPSSCKPGAALELPICNDNGIQTPMCTSYNPGLTIKFDLGTYVNYRSNDTIAHHIATASIDNQWSCSLYTIGSNCTSSETMNCERSSDSKHPYLFGPFNTTNDTALQILGDYDVPVGVTTVGATVRLTGRRIKTEVRLHKPAPSYGHYNKDCTALTEQVEFGYIDGATPGFTFHPKQTAYLGVRACGSNTGPYQGKQAPSFLEQLKQKGVISQMSFALYLPTRDSFLEPNASLTLGGWGAAAAAAVAAGNVPTYLQMDDTVDSGGWAFRGELDLDLGKASKGNGHPPSHSQTNENVQTNASLTVTVSTNDWITSFSAAALGRILALVPPLNGCKNYDSLPTLALNTVDEKGRHFAIAITKELYAYRHCQPRGGVCQCSMAKPNAGAKFAVVLSAVQVGSTMLSLDFHMEDGDHHASQTTKPHPRRLGFLPIRATLPTPAVLYKCHNNQCIKSPSAGSPKADCEKVCG